MEFLKIEDRLLNITADLVEDENLFLDRLFRQPASQWTELEQLCSDLEDIERQIEDLKESFEGKILVTWLNYPNSAPGNCYCMIIFFVEELFWNNMALYNKKYFQEKHSLKLKPS